MEIPFFPLHGLPVGLSWWECCALDERLDPHWSPVPAKFTSTREY